MDRDLIGNACDALQDMIDLATEWATSGPEGFTKNEKRRVRAAEKVQGKLNKLLLKLEGAR